MGKLDGTQRPFWSPVEQKQQELWDPRETLTSGGMGSEKSWGVTYIMNTIGWWEPLLGSLKILRLLQGGSAENVVMSTQFLSMTLDETSESIQN